MEIRLTFFISFISSVLVPFSEANITCTVNDISYICKHIANISDFPILLPANVRKVTLFGTNALDQSFPDGLFRSPTWENVSELSILEFSDVDFIEKDFLDGLKKLKFLSISACPHLARIHPDVFNSTPDIEALYLDGNDFLRIAEVEAALNGKLEKLKYLSLIGIETFRRRVVLGETFSMALGTKYLTYLDISRVKTIFVEHVAVLEILLNVKYLNVSYSTLLTSGDIYIRSDSLFRNLELVDFSSCTSWGKYALKSEDSTLSWVSYPNIKYIFAQHVMDPDIRLRFSARYTLENDVLRGLKLLDLSNNNIIILNITFSGTYDFSELKTFNLSSNNMEYISPSILSGFNSLKILDLSMNQLHKMQSMDVFSYLFSSNNDLEIISLRKNYLGVVPLNLFSSNTKLRLIDLSENELTYLNIDLQNLWDLKLIDLRKNRLKSLPEAFFGQLEQIFFHLDTAEKHKISITNVMLNQFQDKIMIAEKYKYGYNASDHIKLKEKLDIIPQYVMLNVLENPLMCDCDTLDFVEWIIYSDISIVNRTTLTCQYNNNEALLNNAVMEIVRENCRLALSIGIGIASSAAVILSIFAFGITIHLRRRKVRQHNDLEILKREILYDNRHFNFVVFLPYCSQDSHVVDNIILPNLKTFLGKRFNTQEELVCTGADNFVPGMRIIAEIHRCITESLVVVPVITPAFLESHWSLQEFVDAIERRRQVVVLMKQDTDISGTMRTIRHHVSEYTRATWSHNGGHFVIRPSWDAICDGIIQKASETFRNHRRQNRNAAIELLPLVN